MAKILNIDSLSKVNRVLTLGGVEHPILELTVENFIATTVEAAKLKDEKDQGLQLQATVDMIVRSVPTLPRGQLLKISLDNLMLIVRFIQGTLDKDAEGVTETEDAKK